MRSLVLRRIVGCGVVLAVAGGGIVTTASVSGASAAGTGSRPTLTVRRIDSTGAPLTKVDLSTGGAVIDPATFTVRENGASALAERGAKLADVKSPMATVLVINTSTSMGDNDKMTLVRAAAKTLVRSKGPADLMAIVAEGGNPRLVQDLTADPGVLNSTIERLAVGGPPALFGATRIGAGVLINRPDLLGNLIVVGDSGNAVTSDKSTTAASAGGDVLASKAMTFVIGLRFGPSADLGALSALAGAGRGTYVEATDAASLAKAFDSIRTILSTQVELTFTSRLKKGASELSIAANGAQVAAQLVPGGVAVGAATNPPGIVIRQAPGLLRGKAGLALVALLVLAAAGLFAYAIASLITADDHSLSMALRPYSEGGVQAASNDEDAEGSLVSSALMQRAVSTTARIAEEQGLLVKVERKLELANLKLRPAEAILLYGIGLILILALTVATKGLIGGLILTAIVAAAVPAVLNTLARLRFRKFNSQLPDTLQLLSSSLRAGFSFMQGVEAVAQEVEDPMGSELRRVIVEARLGKPVEEALDDCAQRMGSPDFDWAVMAVKIQREVGGNLAELLQTVGTTMVERERLRRDVKSLTAEGRVSGYVLGFLPPGLGLFFYITNPTYMKPLFTNTGGQIALVGAVIAMGVGFAWMNKIVKIEV